MPAEGRTGKGDHRRQARFCWGQIGRASLLAGISDSSGPAPSDPYAGRSCEEKFAAIAREIRAYPASLDPVAKPSASRSDTASPDTVWKPIQVFRSWPPMVGPGSVPDTVKDGSSPGVQWIPTVGFDSLAANPGTLPVTPNPSPETTPPSTLPASVSALQLVSGGAYMARVRIHDYRDALLREFEQDFGFRGEIDNPNRMVVGGRVSYLVWDGKDMSGREASTGVYLWKVRLEMELRQVIEKTSKAGYIGRECRQEP